MFMTTLGELIATLYTKYQRRYRDRELAAIATEVMLDQLLSPRPLPARPVN